MKLSPIAALLALAVCYGAAPAAAQDANEETRRAEALDRALGVNAELPAPPTIRPPSFVLPEAPLPPWLVGQPYRQQPLLSSVPRGGTVGGRVRGSGVH